MGTALGARSEAGSNPNGNLLAPAALPALARLPAREPVSSGGSGI